MDERKFCIGDRVRLESPWGPGDANEGVEGIVVGYTEDTDCPQVQLCDGYTWNKPGSRLIEHLHDGWWAPVESTSECRCESLLYFFSPSKHTLHCQMKGENGCISSMWTAIMKSCRRIMASSFSRPTHGTRLLTI